MLCGLDLKGAVVCHGGCSNARLAAEGWQVSAQRLLIKTSGGRRPVTLSTIALRGGERPIYLHLLRDGAEIPHPQAERAWDREPRLTRRQLEVLRLLGDGMPAKVIARRLGIAETTVRNHIRTILRELGSHSQLEALAKARRLRLVG